MKGLPPPEGDESPLPDLGEGFPPEVLQTLTAGEEALVDLRENTVHRWYLVGGACFLLRNVALSRSGANSPTGKRYNREYAILANNWPHLAKLDKGTRSHSIWLFQNWDAVQAWLATLPQNQRDEWTHPRTIRNHFEKRYPHLMRDKPTAFKPRPPRTKRGWNRQPLGERTREDLEALVAGLEDTLSDRDREIAELNAAIEEKDREIRQLREDLAWERARNRQLAAIVTPPAAATVVRPDGEVAEIVHAVTRASQEITPPVKYGHADYLAWAKRVLEHSDKLSALELHYLLADNSEHLDEYEHSFPGAGIGLEDRIRERIDKLERFEVRT
jgi:hypothetical protein